MLKYLFYICLLSIIIGPLVNFTLDIPGVHIYLTDILTGFLSVFLLLNLKKIWPLIRQDKITLFFSLFVMMGFLSLFFSPISLSLPEKSVSALYILRFTSYFSLYVISIYIVRKKIVKGKDLLKLLGFTGLILAVVGWFFYFFYPDLRNLYYLGWDPHYKRIFGSFFDPNYFGLMMVLTLITLFSQPNKTLIWFTRIFIFISLMFTYSRSSYLALLGAVLTYSLLKKKYILITGVFIILILSALVLPRPGGEGVKLERLFTLEQRIGNWQEGFKIFIDHPIFGIGFNSVRFAKKQYGMGGKDLLVSHSGAGFDNSFLFVATTTGLTGLIFYLLLLKQFFVSHNLLLKISLTAIIIHSFFLNSLFFPWVMLWLWILMGIDKKDRFKF